MYLEQGENLPHVKVICIPWHMNLSFEIKKEKKNI